MSYLDAILLGVIQGLTEFLPISSSGHLVLTEQLLGVKQSGVTFELLAHLGTLLAVLVYFRQTIGQLIKSLWTPAMVDQRKMVLALVLGTIPAGVIGLLFKDFFESVFDSPVVVSSMLIVTGLILLSTRLVAQKDGKVTWRSALLIGCGQALAIFPGISRSGSTIAAGMLLGVKPALAAEFSFLLAVPAIGGAVILHIGDLTALDSAVLGPMLAGTVVSFIFGLMAVSALLAIIRRGRFDFFAYYCFAAGALGLYLFL